MKKRHLSLERALEERDREVVAGVSLSLERERIASREQRAERRHSRERETDREVCSGAIAEVSSIRDDCVR